jgi:hypothetical protein
MGPHVQALRCECIETTLAKLGLNAGVATSKLNMSTSSGLHTHYGTGDLSPCTFYGPMVDLNSVEDPSW